MTKVPVGGHGSVCGRGRRASGVRLGILVQQGRRGSRSARRRVHEEWSGWAKLLLSRPYVPASARPERRQPWGGGACVVRGESACSLAEGVAQKRWESGRGTDLATSVECHALVRVSMDVACSRPREHVRGATPQTMPTQTKAWHGGPYRTCLALPRSADVSMFCLDSDMPTRTRAWHAARCGRVPWRARGGPPQLALGAGESG